MPRTPERALAFAAMCLALAACRPRSGGDDGGAARGAHDPALPAESKPVRIIYPAAPGSFVDLAADLRESVVHIRSTTKVTGGPDSIFPGEEDGYALGSGVIYDTNGHILTNDHVLADAHEFRVVLSNSNEQLAATVIGRDPKLDLAVLKIDASARLRPAPLGDSDQLHVGEWVVALGNPFGDEVTVSAGIVTALGHTSRDRIVGSPRVNYRSFLQTDAAINAGNSGGPLVNTAGQVVGLNTAVDRRRASVGLAVPIDRVKRMVPVLRDEGGPVRAWLGIFIHPVTREVARERNMQAVTGALVSQVIPGGPAARTGIKPGDVILKFHGHDVDHKNFPELATTTGIGNEVEIVIWRNGGKRRLTLISERRPK